MDFGWRSDLERREQLTATATPFELPMLGDPPEELDPRGHIKTENQCQQGSCQGHDISTCVEHCYWIATRGKVLQFSRAHGYYGAQRIDGLLGRDQGSTISGGVELVSRVGLCLESDWPYPANYSPRPPTSWEDIEQKASAFKIQSHSVLRGYDEVFNYLATGTGAVTIGTAWGFTPNSQGVVERYSGSGGGHATAVLGYSKRKDSAGRRYLWLANSWGESWGLNGWAEISPSAMQAALSNNYAVAIGVSDLKHPRVRPISWGETPPV